MRVGLGVDQLCVDPDLVIRSLDAPFEHIAYAEIATDLLRVDRLVFVGERGIPRDHKHMRDP
jgi:hypothetical protein